MIDSLPYLHAAGDGGPRPVTQVVVIHATDNTAPASGEASYATRRADKTSAHFYVDDAEAYRALPLGNIAYGCLYHGNRISVQFELCGRSNRISNATMRRAAPIVAEVCARYGLPVRKLTASDVAAGAKGICGHLDITAAFPQDHGDHTDPGASFPWATFIGYVQAAADGGGPTSIAPREGREMYDKISKDNPRTGGSSPAVGGPGNWGILRIASFWGDSRLAIDIRGGGLAEPKHVEVTVKDGPNFYQEALPDGAVFSARFISGRDDGMTFAAVETLRNVS